MSDRFSNLIEFIHIYIDEAHPKDGWYIGDVKEIYNHKDINERCKAAENIAEKVNNVYADTMDNKLKNFFGVQYERLYIIYNDKIVYQGGQGPFDYNLSEVEDFLFNSV